MIGKTLDWNLNSNGRRDIFLPPHSWDDRFSPANPFAIQIIIFNVLKLIFNFNFWHYIKLKLIHSVFTSSRTRLLIGWVNNIHTYVSTTLLYLPASYTQPYLHNYSISKTHFQNFQPYYVDFSFSRCVYPFNFFAPSFFVIIEGYKNPLKLIIKHTLYRSFKFSTSSNWI